jgi:hypothetical protein
MACRGGFVPFAINLLVSVISFVQDMIAINTLQQAINFLNVNIFIFFRLFKFLIKLFLFKTKLDSLPEHNYVTFEFGNV